MTHTKDLLADELMKLGLMDMSLQARGGYYHDFLSPLATPELQLCEDLHKAALKRPDKAAEIMALRQRVMDGDFDASPAESDEWAKSEEGQEAFAKLMPKKEHLGDAPIEQKHHRMMNTIAGVLGRPARAEGDGMSKRKNPYDDDGFRRWADDMRKRLIPKMADSASILMIAPRMESEFDIEFALQIGASILLEKPLILLVDRTRTIPPKLRAIADRIIETDLNNMTMDAADTQKQIQQAIAEFSNQ
jgi:hypothetical protein